MRLTLLFLLLSGTLMAQDPSALSYQRTPLDADWKFTSKENGTWRQAVVPGHVFADLQRTGVIQDPFQGTNEAELQWIGESDWIYQSEPFDVDPDLLGQHIVRLRFNGLDTYADVFLNDDIILRADNAFRTWEVDVKGLLRRKGNVLRIEFRSPITEGNRKLELLPYPLPGDGLRAVTRKPQFHFGWDWGPKLLTCGITREVEIISYSRARFEDVYIRQDEVTEKNAHLTAIFEIHAPQSDACSLFFELPQTKETWRTAVELRKGLNLVELPIDIPWPRRWWCNDLGDPHLYTFHTWMMHGDERIDERTIRTGLRTIDLETKKDSIGESFQFVVNGEPVFAKGANYIPLTYFPNSATEEDYRRILTQCRDAHFNMIRVWGGGVYEEDVFYDICDELGIMVWQDFMFACSMYPADSAFVSGLISEAEEQTRRLRNHASIALWCGNNENAEGWERWGWQTGLLPRDKDRIWRAYLDVFDLTLRPIVQRNTQTDYWESSPRWGRGDARSLTEGDSHYWGVWHDEEPFDILKNKVPRFMSEFGMQSFPSPAVVREMTAGQNPSFEHPGFAQHQKHPRGFQLMKDYMKRWYPGVDESNVELYARLTQVVQAEGMCMGIEAQRRAMPRCMGTLYWQLNDVWPSFSWSSIDYRGNEKLFFTMLREVYAPQLISVDVTEGELSVFFINDNGKEIPPLNLYLAIRKFDGTEYVSHRREGVVLGQPVQRLFSDNLKKLTGNKSAKDMVIIVELSDNTGHVHYRRYTKLVPESDHLLVPTAFGREVMPAVIETGR